MEERKSSIIVDVLFFSSAGTPSRPGTAMTTAEQGRLLQTIQQQAEQISSLISTVNSQVY